MTKTTTLIEQCAVRCRDCHEAEAETLRLEQEGWQEIVRYSWRDREGRRWIDLTAERPLPFTREDIDALAAAVLAWENARALPGDYEARDRCAAALPVARKWAGENANA